MNTKSAVEGFLAERTLAVVGVSRDARKFGNVVYKDLKSKGYRVFAVNPNTTSIDGDPCYPDLASLPETPGGVVVVVPPSSSELVVRDAKAADVRRVWFQQGAESPEAVKFCEANGMSVVAGECIFMFTEPMAFFHKPHRWLWGVLGKLPR